MTRTAMVGLLREKLPRHLEGVNQRTIADDAGVAKITVVL
jgi:hypothetical protein